MPNRCYLSLLFALISVLIWPGISQGQAVPPVAQDGGKPWVCAYYLSGDDGSGRLPATAIDFSAITHLIHFGLFPNADGTLGFQSWANATDFTSQAPDRLYERNHDHEPQQGLHSH